MSSWVIGMEVIILIAVILCALLFARRRQRISRAKAPKRQQRPPLASVRQSSPPAAPVSRGTTDVGRLEPWSISPIRAEPIQPKRVLQGGAYVVDGDTIKVEKTQIRLFGIDAPELDHPFGKKAMWDLRKLCKGQTIRVEVIEEDTHGRTVGHCCLPDGRDLSAEMVKRGLALDWPQFSGGKYKHLETPDARKNSGWLMLGKRDECTSGKSMKHDKPRSR